MASTPPADGRRPDLGFASLLALGINGIVGVGIFFTPQQVAGRVPGFDGVVVYLATALALAPIALTYARLGGHFPRDGGPYVWARQAFGPRAAYLVGWIAYASALVSMAAVMAGLVQHAAPTMGFEGEWMGRAFAVVSVVGLAGIAATGLKPSAWAWTTITLLKLSPLILLAVLGFVAVVPDVAAAPEPRPAATWVDFGRAVLIVVFATQGFEVVPVPAGNARASARSIPLATVGCLVVAALLYVALHAACVKALPELAASDAPLVDAAGVYGGTSFATIVAIGTNVSAFGIAFAMFAMSPRYLFALRSDDALGDWVGEEDRRHVPRRALLLTAAAVLGLSLSKELTQLFELASVAVLAQYGVSAAALVVLALRRVNGLRPHQLWPAPLGLVSIVIVGFNAQAIELLTWGGILVLGVGLMLLRRHLRSESSA